MVLFGDVCLLLSPSFHTLSIGNPVKKQQFRQNSVSVVKQHFSRSIAVYVLYLTFHVFDLSNPRDSLDVVGQLGVPIQEWYTNK